MIYPTRRAIVLAALGAPGAVALDLVAPGAWTVVGGWLALIVGLTLIDALIGPGRGDLDIASRAPASLGMVAGGALTIRAAFAGAAPAAAELAVETDARLAATPDRLIQQFSGGEGEAVIRLVPRRRGVGAVTGVWLRWRGPLGLTWKQARRSPAHEIAIVPNIGAVREAALQLFARDALFGLKSQLDTGEGAEFHALREMTGAMDTRAIDWKQSARHGKLLGKEFRVERNHPVVLAIDAGRLMCEPVEGVARLDHAINAVLLLAFVCLKLGDRVALFGFDSRPRLFTGFQSGATAFPRLQRLAAGLDYCSEETNFTLGLTHLAAVLERRSLVVVFSDFADTTTAALMLDNVARLARRHRVLFVVTRDEELAAIARAEPRTADDVSRAVTAAALMHSREVVIEQLRRLGIQILEAPAAAIGAPLIGAYLALKREDRL